MCDEIMDAKANSYDEETKIIPAYFNKINAVCKTKIFIFYLPFY